MCSWLEEYTHLVEPGCSHVPSCIRLDSVRFLLSLYVECRDACHFPQIFLLGLDCEGHLYLEIAVLLISFHSVTLMYFPSPVLMSDRQVDFRNNLNMLSSARSFPSRPYLRKSYIIKDSFSLCISWFAVFPQGLGCIPTVISMCLKSKCW